MGLFQTKYIKAKVNAAFIIKIEGRLLEIRKDSKRRYYFIVISGLILE